MVPALLKFDGEAKVTSDGHLLYEFKQFQRVSSLANAARARPSSGGAADIRWPGLRGGRSSSRAGARG